MDFLSVFSVISVIILLFFCVNVVSCGKTRIIASSGPVCIIIIIIVLLLWAAASEGETV